MFSHTTIYDNDDEMSVIFTFYWNRVKGILQGIP